MTAIASLLTGAPPTDEITWNSICWAKVIGNVYRLQIRIAKATCERRYGKVKALQRLLTHSFSAKLLAVKRVTDNAGSKTAGIDGVIWKTAKEKIQAACSLRRHGYHPRPLRRIYIPKKIGKRPLGIPTMYDRAQQAIHLLSLEPVAESTADTNSYGFRAKRSCHDAIEQCFNALSKRTSAQYILEGDIRACFDKISHQWLELHILMDTKILSKWLNSGYIDRRIFHRTEEGTPQGGIISPTLANMVLDGMESLVKNIGMQPDKINFIRYADDFIITGSSYDLLEQKVMPAIARFLEKRGLTLSREKSKITSIDEGFDFLGFNIRKYNGKLLIRPSKQNVLSFIREIRKHIKENKTASASELIRKLNPKIRGWANYYQHAVAKKSFAYIDHCIFQALWRWAKRRHPNKNASWIRKKYFRTDGMRQWIFFSKSINKKGSCDYLNLFLAGKVRITRHIKIRQGAHPFDPNFKSYFEARKSRCKYSPRDAGHELRHLTIF